MDFSDNIEYIILALIGNILNLAYNIPFVYLVWKNKSSKNISGTFLGLRFLGSVSWLLYGILIKDYWIGLSYIITLTATIIIIFVKFKERSRKNIVIDSSEIITHYNKSYYLNHLNHLNNKPINISHV